MTDPYQNDLSIIALGCVDGTDFARSIKTNFTTLERLAVPDVARLRFCLELFIFFVVIASIGQSSFFTRAC